MSAPYMQNGPRQDASNPYPYPPNQQIMYDSQRTLNKSEGMELSSIREISRTPSPTPSEEDEMSRASVINWRPMLKWRFWIRREWLWYYIIGAVIIAIVAFFSFYDKQIVHFLQPAANWVHALPAGFLIPIGIFFVISFPPLFGQEIVAIVCGLTWGLWIGFAIVAAGTFVGEVGNFYAFKYCCSARSEKMQNSKIYYACFAKVVRQGGLKIAIISRLSIVPGHLTTAVYSTCGMSIWVFSIAAFLSLPKQFVTVYIGVLLDSSADGTETTKSRLISAGVFTATGLMTVFACWYILKELNKVKPQVIYERRKARQAKLARVHMPYENPNGFGSTISVGFNPRDSDSDIPLTASHPAEQRNSYQQWDAQGRAVGYAGDPQLYAPQPKRASLVHERIPTYRTEGGGGYSTSGERYDRDLNSPGAGRRDSADLVGWDMRNRPDEREQRPDSAATQTQVPRIAPPPGLQQSASPRLESRSPPLQSRNPYYNTGSSPRPFVHPQPQSQGPTQYFYPGTTSPPTQGQPQITNPSAPYSPQQYASYPQNSRPLSLAGPLPSPSYPLPSPTQPSTQPATYYAQVPAAYQPSGPSSSPIPTTSLPSSPFPSNPPQMHVQGTERPVYPTHTSESNSDLYRRQESRPLSGPGPLPSPSFSISPPPHTQVSSETSLYHGHSVEASGETVYMDAHSRMGTEANESDFAPDPTLARVSPTYESPSR